MTRLIFVYRLESKEHFRFGKTVRIFILYNMFVILDSFAVVIVVRL